MIPKDLIFNNEAKDSLLKGVSVMAKAVKSTIGPLGKTVLIESEFHTNGITITKDGVTVAKSIDLEHPVENLAVRMMKDAAQRTADSAGDGTSTAVVLTESLVDGGFSYMKQNNIDSTEFVKDMNRAIDEVIVGLDEASIPVEGEGIRDVAIISSNNDIELGTLISDVYKEVGKDGIVIMDKSMDDKTYYEVTNGIKIERGYTSALFVNNQENDECIMEDVYVLLTDIEIPNIMAIENILKPIIQERKKLLIISECNKNVINTLGANVVKNGVEICNIVPPEFGYKSKELMADIAISIGGKFISESFGEDLSLVGIEDLGFVKKVVVGREETIMVKDEEHCNCGEVDKRIAELAVQMKNAKGNAKEFLNLRVASLSGGVGVVYVGGNSDVEQKEKYDRVEDAVKAVRAALDDGILPGGGVALLRESFKLTDTGNIAYDIVANSLKSPMITILENADIDPDDVIDGISKLVPYNTGMDVKREQWGDMIEMGIIDPTKVTKNALKNAVSVATTILTTNAIITLKRDDRGGS
jgi:chaperonin GroEL